MNHQNSLKSRPGNNKGIKYHRWLYIISFAHRILLIQYVIQLYIYLTNGLMKYIFTINSMLGSP